MPAKRASASASTRSRKAARPSATPITDSYIAKGDFNPLWQRLRELDPEFMEAYLAFRDVPHRNGPLPPHFKELILVAINAATTHLYAPGLRRHMQNALRLGATPAEVLETIQLTTVMGIHSCNLAIPILVEEVERAGLAGAGPADASAAPGGPAAAPAAGPASASASAPARRRSGSSTGTRKRASRAGGQG